MSGVVSDPTDLLRRLRSRGSAAMAASGMHAAAAGIPDASCGRGASALGGAAAWANAGERVKTAAAPEAQAPVGQARLPGLGPVPASTHARPPAEVDFRLLEEAEAARRVVAGFAERGEPVALDLETTGLDPLTAQARLLQLAPASGPVVVVDLAKAGGLHALHGPLETLRAVAHNAVFDLSFLHRAGVQGMADCTMLAAHVLTGRRLSLAALAEEHLGLNMA